LPTTKQKTRKPKPEYVEGAEARQHFEKTMKVLFQVSKIDSKKAKKGKD
jgi:hypothetical protein